MKKENDTDLIDALNRERIGWNDIEQALLGAKAIVDKALPKFNWADSALDADAIAALNEGQIAIDRLFQKAKNNG